MDEDRQGGSSRGDIRRRYGWCISNQVMALCYTNL